MAVAGWMQHVDDCASITLFPRRTRGTRGANIPGKPRVFMPYTAGVDFYRAGVRRGGGPGLPGIQTVWTAGGRNATTAWCADCSPTSRWCSSRSRR